MRRLAWVDKLSFEIGLHALETDRNGLLNN